MMFGLVEQSGFRTHGVCIAEGEEDVLSFTVGGYGDGFYGWRFPSGPGRVSVGFPRGHTDPSEVEGILDWGARDLPFGV